MSGTGARRAGTQATGPVSSRKARDATLILPLVGAVLLMPPAIDAVAVEGRVLGVPLVVAYIFAVWAGLIVAAFLLGRRLARMEADEARPPAP